MDATINNALTPGTVVGGRYQVVSLIGEGGYGAVYVAVQSPLGRRVALKVLHPGVLGRDTARERFVREAEVTQSLTHPNVVRLFDFGTTDQGMPYIVWELLDGRSIEHEIARSGPLPVSRVSRITKQILKALAEAHARGIVHRDIKPGNVFLSDFAGEPDFVKVLDFGIARAPKEHKTGGLTQEGVSLGTPAYMAPEQVLDEALDGRADLYAVGLLMSEMLSGVPVFRGDNAMKIAMQQIDAAPVPLPPVVSGSPLGAVIVRAAQKDPAHRFGSALEMLAWLEQLPTESGAFLRQSTGPQANPSAQVLWTYGSTTGSQSLSGAFAPTTGVATPHAGTPALGPLGPGPRTASAHLLPAHQPTAGNGAQRWVLLSVSLALLAGLLGALVFLRRGDGVVSKRRAVTSQEESEPAEKEQEQDEFDKQMDALPGEIMKGVLDSMKNGGTCGTPSKEAMAVSVKGLRVDLVLSRLLAAGLTCKSHVHMGRFGNFMLDGGGRTIWVHYGDGQYVAVFGQQNTIAFAENPDDPRSGAVIVLLARSNPEAAKAGEIARGKAKAF